MAARTVRCIFNNRTSETITKTTENVNWGIITDPWAIPSSIGPGQTAEWRTESDGFMTGTEGFAHFIVSDGTAQNNLVAHWDNPFFGPNNCSMDVTMDFTGAPSTSFVWKCGILTAYYPNLVKMLEGDIEAWIDGILFPPYIITNGNFAADDTTAFFVLDMPNSGSVSSPLFTAPTTKALTEKPNSERNTSQWVGTWVTDGIAVTITDLGGGLLNAHITEVNASPGTNLDFSEDFRFWSLSMSMVHAMGLGAGKALGIDPTMAMAAVKHSSLLLGDDRKSKAPQGASAAFSRSIATALSSKLNRVSKTELDKVSKGIGLAIESSKFTVSLGNGVYLQLYDQFDDKNKVGSIMHYERHVLGNAIVRKARLEFVIPLH